MKNKFLKTFIAISIFTAICWTISFALATYADEKPYPQKLFSHLVDRINENHKEVHISKSIPLQDFDGLIIEAKNLDITFSENSGQAVDIDLVGFADSKDPLTFEVKNNSLNIKIDGEPTSHWRISNSNIEVTKSLKLKVTAPPSIIKKLTIATGSGDIRIVDAALENASLETGSGDIEVSKLNAIQVNAHTGSGDLKVSGHLKLFEGRTGSGDVAASSINGERIELKTGSGKISLEEIRASNVVTRTGSGDVTVHIGQPEAWTTEARTGSGEIQSNLPGAKNDSGATKIKIGSGANQLDIETGSGDITINL